VENVLVGVDSSQYSLEAVNAALCSMIDDATPILDADGSIIQVSFLQKKNITKNDLKAKFTASLASISKRRAEKGNNAELKKEIIRKSLMQDLPLRFPAPDIGFDDEGIEDLENSLLTFEQESLEDPLGISVPWREQRR